MQLSSCSGVKDGFYVNAGSGCKSYTYCHQGIADVFRCLPGTLFNEEENICLPESSVSCDSAYRQEAQQSHNAVERELDSDEQIQNDLAMLKQKLEKERALKAEEEEKKRQIKFRELRDLLDTLRETLDSNAGHGDDSEEEGQRPPK